MQMMLQLVVRFLHFEPEVSLLGPAFGYFPNASKTWLVTKKQFCSIGGDTYI